MAAFKIKSLSSILIFVSGFAAALLLLYGYTYFYLLSGDFDTDSYDSKLITLGKQCTASQDVPVASLLIYKGKIIGEGKNDVIKNQNPSGHAELNAIADCFKNIGYQKFKSLDRGHLILLTTYEPCTMCKGAIQEYGIQKVVFSFAKRKADKFLNFKHDLKYYYHLKQAKNKRLQYDLFKLHPHFDTIQYPY
jgi:guanine deaminase